MRAGVPPTPAQALKKAQRKNGAGGRVLVYLLNKFCEVNKVPVLLFVPLFARFTYLCKRYA